MILPLVWTLGCGNEQQGVRRDSATDRYTRRFLPFQDEWIRESEIPDLTQESPSMVIWEVSEVDPHIAPTPEQRESANEFLERCFQVALDRDWFDRSNGMRDGFHLPLPREGAATPSSVTEDKKHHRHDAYILDGITLDPERPEYLMYYALEDGRFALTGFMFLVDAPESRGPQLAGPLSIWHYHLWKTKRCFVQGMLTAGLVDRDGNCERGVGSHRSPEMLHVWLIDNPRGIFSTGMMLPPKVLLPGLAKRMRERGI